MASILDLLKQKNPGISLADARSAMGLTPGASFDMLGNAVPTQDPTPEPAPLLSPVPNPVPAEPQIYREGFDPVAAMDIERNQNNMAPPAPQRAPAISAPAKAMSVPGPSQESMAEPVEQKAPEKSKEELEQEAKNKAFEDQVAKEDAAASDGNVDALAGQASRAPASEAPANPENLLAQRFKDAQESRRNAEDAALYAKIGAQLGGGIGRQSKDVVKGNMDLADAVGKRGGRDMQELEESLAFQKQDPNSDYSKSAKKFLKDKFNVNIPEDVSAEQLDKTFMAPALKSFEADQNREAKVAQLKSEHQFKDAELKQKIDQAKDKLAEDKRNHEDTADIKRDQQDLMRMLAQSKADDKETTRNEKLEKDAHSRLDKLGKAVTAEVASSRSAFGRAANNVRSAQAALNLADQYKGHEDDMDSRQVAEFARSLDGLLSSGQPTVSGLQKLIPNTLLGKKQTAEEFLSNIPKGAKQGEFIRRARETVEREKGLAVQQINQTQGKLFSPYRDLAEKYPEQFNDIVEGAGVDPSIISFNKGSKAASKDAAKKSPNSADKPKTVIQNGHTYNLNEETGEYE